MRFKLRREEREREAVKEREEKEKHDTFNLLGEDSSVSGVEGVVQREPHRWELRGEEWLIISHHLHTLFLIIGELVRVLVCILYTHTTTTIIPARKRCLSISVFCYSHMYVSTPYVFFLWVLSECPISPNVSTSAK